MKINSTRERLLASSMICGAALLGLSATSASAAAAAAAASGEVSEIVVTGTRIPTPNLTSVAPVTSVTSADIKAQGISRVEDLLNSLPQSFAAQGSNVSNGSNGTATVNLRGLGANRTLVLIDGRRLQAGNPTSGIGAIAADLNFIPPSLIERVDVLTGGASAVYGADAVAGVVNFIMNRNFEGVRLDAQYSIYQHSQHEGGVSDVVRQSRSRAAVPDNFIVPGDFKGGEGDTESITIGVNAPDGKGNVTAYATHVQINPVLASSYDYTACTLNSGATFLQAGCGGSGTAFPTRFGSFIVDPSGPGNTFRARTSADVYNFSPTNYLQRPDQRYGMGAFAHYEINPHFQAYADLMFMDDNSTAAIAPGGIFASSGPGPGGTFAVNCDNPLMTAVQQGQLCGAAAGTATNVNVAVARRNVEGGGRLTIFEHQEQRYVIGLKGDLAADWSYDAYMQYGKTSLSQEQDNNFLTSRINRALIARRNAAGQIVCQSVIDGTDPACVPYNSFQLGGVTPAALNYLQAPTFSGGNIIEQIASANVVGSLPDSIKSPWSMDKIGVSIGAEYRREHLDSKSDVPQATGDVNGNGAAKPPVNGGYDVYELYGEARVPLVQDMPFAKDITAELAYRFSDYSNAGTTNTYKASGDWTIVDGVRLRAGYNRAVRAPNVVELFSPQNVVLDGTVDPCAGLTAGNALVARCATLFGLTTAQVLALEPDPASQYNGQTGGNPNLKPETSDTYTVGLVWSPSFLPGANLTVDWFDIKVQDYISNVGANVILNGCVNGTNPDFCSLVHRDAIGSIKSTQGFVTDTVINQGALHTSGVDVNASYRTGLDTFGLSNAGSVSANFVGTWLDKLETTVLNGTAAIDCAGLYGSTCTTLGGSANPNPKWRHKLRVTWNTPFEYGFFGNLGLSAQWRYFSSVDVDGTSSQPALHTLNVAPTDKTLSSRSYLDLLATFKVKDNYSFRVGINNILDRDPPLAGSGGTTNPATGQLFPSNCPAGACNQNVYAQMYDTLGRYIFVGLTADF
ncbi:TonB-dependent receptor domain-containing protein [Phenylobacterium sp.]|uniref:TonB-dependent receptor domain-containing protein n=1 Tax=Phenylobacterium sp. TaxID=1871053 RepID=UPI003562405E